MLNFIQIRAAFLKRIRSRFSNSVNKNIRQPAMQQPIPEILNRCLFPILGVLLFFGCSKDNTDPGILVDVPTTFNVRMIEHLDSTGRSLSFQVSTIEFRDCLNETIDYNLFQNQNSVQLSLNEIVAPETCMEGSAPATVSILLPDLVKYSYKVQISLKNTIENNGTLINEDTRYRLDMETFNGFQVLNPELLKVPEHVIWGSFAFRSEDMATISQAFFQELEQLAHSGTFPTGDYGHFYVISDQNVFILDQSPSDLSFRRNFLYYFSGDPADLTNLLETYRSEYSADIDILMQDDLGKSW
ncbi:MAG: hypothetical protein KDC34_05075 [Saprospiraceae bacterium]|nr:hypothetical protein [Saprospiraceae bacterium]